MNYSKEIENYFINSQKEFADNKKLVLVIYDIIDNKRRNKFVKFLESYGVRVQKSAFEMVVSKHQYNDVIKSIPRYINEDDNVRVYRLKPNENIVSWGSGMTTAEDVIII